MAVLGAMRTIAARAAGAILVLLAVSSLAALPASAASPDIRGSQLLGKPVRIAGGNVGAWVFDVMIDASTGEVRALVLDLAEPDGIKRRVRVPMPAPGLGFRDGRLEVDLRRKALVALPRWEASAPHPGAQRLSAILDARLRDRQGAAVGDIDEVMLRLEEGRVSSLAVRFDPDWVDMDGLAALPLASVRHEGEDFVALFEPDYVRPAGARKPTSSRAAAPAAPAIDPLARLSRVVSAEVVDPKGAVLGKIRDVFVDVASRQVTGLSLAMSADAAAAARVTARFPQPALRFEAGKLVVDGDPQRLSRIDKRGKPVSAARLLEAQVLDRRGEAVGDLEEAVVNLRTGRVRYAVARFDPDWVQAGMLVVVPLRATRPAPGGGLAMVFGLNELNRAYLFDQARWPDFKDPRVRATIDAYVSRL